MFLIQLMLLSFLVTNMRSSYAFRRIHRYASDMKLSSTMSPLSNGQPKKGLSMAALDDAFYVTTPIYYVNGEPHLGHAYTSVACDVMARFARKCGKETLFLTGTDEHGQKVQQSAERSGKTPQEFADGVADRFRLLVDTLGCSHDDFIRTTEDRHKAGVKELWKRLEEKGFIYKGAYEGWYSIRDEAFYTEDELIDGNAPTGAEVEWVKEESYFFKLSVFTEPLLDYYKKHPDFIGPDGRRNEVVAFVGQQGGLRDLSISRTTFSWGVPVPENEDHVVYVWLDALTNYISALGYPDETSTKMSTFWPADVHVVGKDILRFHAVFWPAFMMAAELPLPKRIFAHGWWTKDGEKMSKSVGNVLDPFKLVDEYGVDFVRYFLVAEVPFGNDGDFSRESFALRVNSNLANELGNLVQRVVTMVAKNCNQVIPEPESGLLPEDENLIKAAADALDECKTFMEKQQLHRMVNSIIKVAKMSNKYIDVQAPWNLKKTDVPRMKTVLYTLAETIRRMAIMLEPVIPMSCGRILDLIGASEELRTFASIADDSRLVPGTAVLEPTPIFPRIEENVEVK